jgi:hypothetical protein
MPAAYVPGTSRGLMSLLTTGHWCGGSASSRAPHDGRDGPWRLSTSPQDRKHSLCPSAGLKHA